MKKVVRILAVVAVLGVTSVSCSKSHTSDLDTPEIENPISVDPGYDGPAVKEPRQ